MHKKVLAITAVYPIIVWKKLYKLAMHRKRSSKSFGHCVVHPQKKSQFKEKSQLVEKSQLKAHFVGFFCQVAIAPKLILTK